jgi:hypothetical protein
MKQQINIKERAEFGVCFNQNGATTQSRTDFAKS